MPQAQCFGLADVDAIHVLRKQIAHELKHFCLVLALQLVLEFVGLVKMVLDRPLRAAGDKDHVGDARRCRLFNRVLDQRLVDHRQHLLGASLGRGQKTGTHAGDGKNGFPDFLH